jgi:hypothetical protein
MRSRRHQRKVRKVVQHSTPLYDAPNVIEIFAKLFMLANSTISENFGKIQESNSSEWSRDFPQSKEHTSLHLQHRGGSRHNYQIAKNAS